MSKKNVDDYLQEGMYGTRLPKESERKMFLGTLRERIAFVLTIGEVMSNKGLAELERQLKQHPKAKILLNGNISYQFLKEEKALADRFSIPHTTVSNQENDTEIGLVLTYAYAIDAEHIYLKDIENMEAPKETEDSKESTEKNSTPSRGIVSKLKNLFH
ncbi:YueI family protein [Oceanobacillus jeddahense]|uniref:YueI family protein n=1 Tax=Oceanobacillus jeddahense TaxID=1462527 RepID=A0ABY5JUL5_9BACI|nr:YueI family protein [Oceanobacillus jeddahense]UUI04052.1 YueI family protein [Oceanobacillus jeddahense]